MKPRCRHHWGHGLWYAVGGPVSRRQATWRFGEMSVLATRPERWKYPAIDRELWSDPYEEAAKLLWPDKDKPA